MKDAMVAAGVKMGVRPSEGAGVKRRLGQVES